ncbi:MAG: hypothetical protein IK088_08445 [Lachnospiraceae bacterium]|nr:hypothetical protein [Lachnospiraceae bacterium]
MQEKTLFFKPIGNPNRKYRQDHFIISSCVAFIESFKDERSDLKECTRLIKETGCNLAEFIWADPDETMRCIDACEEAGIDGVFQKWDAFGGFQARKGIMELNREATSEFMAHCLAKKHFYGYYVWDEPQSEASVSAAAKQLNEMEKMDPDHLLFTVAIPSYNEDDTWENGRFESYLRRYAETIDPPVLSLDYYPISSKRPDPEDPLDDKPLFLDIALLRKLSIERKTPMWFYIQTLDQPAHSVYRRFLPEKMTMQAFNVILHGGKAVQYYCTVDGAVYSDGRPGPLFFEMKKLNRTLESWGRTLMALQSEGVYHSPEVLRGNPAFDEYREPLSESRILSDRPLPFRASVGEFSDKEGNRYLIILNRDYLERRRFSLRLKNPFRIYEVDKETGLQRLRNRKTTRLELDLKPGDAVLLRFQDASEEPCLLRYELKRK